VIGVYEFVVVDYFSLVGILDSGGNWDIISIFDVILLYVLK